MTIDTKKLVGDLFKENGAIFSACEKYRYLLWRHWYENKPRRVTFVMLNPSTADETIDDRTVAKCGVFARLWNFGGLEVVNVFAWRDTDPAAMKKAEDPIGPDNDKYIYESCLEAGLVVCAWGNHGGHLNRAMYVLTMLKCDRAILPHALKLNINGEPAHPLYQPFTRKPFLIWQQS